MHKKVSKLIIKNEQKRHLKQSLYAEEIEQAEKVKLIRYISERSDWYGNRLIDFMKQYNVHNLTEATSKQLKEYVKKNKLYEVPNCKSTWPHQNILGNL